MQTVMKLSRATKRLSDGRVKRYVYAWRGGPRLLAKEGTENFRREYEAAVLTRKGALQALSYKRGRHGYMQRRLDMDRFVRQRLIPNCRARATVKKIEFALSVDDVREMVARQCGCCAITGIPFDLLWRYGKGVHTNPFAPSLDRVDNTGGYTITNTRLVLFAVNAALNEWGIEVLEQIAAAIVARKAAAG